LIAENMAPLVQNDLDTAECERSDCKGGHPVFLHSMCHPSAGLDAGYSRHTGCIEFYCNKCKDFVTQVLVGVAPVN